MRGHAPSETLDLVAGRAARQGASCEDVLIAEGWMSADAFYARLADHLGVDFLSGPVAVDGDADWRAALRTGVVRLADGRWLFAPRGAAIPALIQRLPPGPARGRVVLSTPAVFERAVFKTFAGAVAADAAERLPRARPDLSACSGANGVQRGLAVALCILLPIELNFGLRLWAAALLVLAVAMCAAVLVKILATVASLAPEREAPQLADGDLPFYSVIVALYDEAAVASRLVAAMRALDYPAAKHEVIFIIEQEDAATREALEASAPPPHMRIVVAPAGAPRTKPRALNIGMTVARGERLVVYDAEDAPDPDQLRKAAARFHAGSPKLAVLQAQLRIENRADSWLTRLFAIDYASQFEVLLPGLARLGLPLPLGGTSNHFRTDILREAGGWDAWNVTEDADLGLRLARLGYVCGALRSNTLEEAPPALRDWFPQRRRWLKGWMQTLLTHTRRPFRLMRELGPARALHVVAMLASNTLGPAVGLWITLYVLHEAMAGDFLVREGAGLRVAAWLWASLAAFGVFSIILPILAAISRARLWTCAPWLALQPLQWLCVSAAALRAAQDLWARPHHWLKTRHGLARKKGLR